MKRSMPLRNSGFSKSLSFMDEEQRRAARTMRMANMAEAVRAAPACARGVITRVLGPAAPVPKEDVSQSGAYMVAAKALGYCVRCSKPSSGPGSIQFCHADMDKGQGIKTDVRRGWPGCIDCHETVGRRMLKPVRRAIEYLLGVMTRAAVREAGTWPKNLSDWIER
jgi:hypothetical protein